MNFLNIITPTNLEEEKLKFFSNQDYNPIFKYSWQISKPKVEVKGKKSALIKSIIEQDINLIDKNARSYFEIDKWDYLERAKRITESTPQLNLNENIEDFIQGFTNAFQLLDLNGYKINLVDVGGFNFRPSLKTKEIVMSKSANFQFFSAEGEVRHELVHIIRYENGKYNNIKKSSNYLPTEEGLATLMQDTSTDGVASEFQHAAEYIASSIGSSGSLRDIFEYFISIGFNKDLAWQRASRHKFGFVNTSEPGDIFKPAMYFANSQKIKSLNKDDILKLFVGKITLSKLKEYEHYEGIVNKDKLINFYNLL